MMWFLLLAPVVFAVTGVGAVVAGPSAARRAAAILIAGCGLGIVRIVPSDEVLARGILAVGSCFLFLRMFDVVAEARRPALQRLALACCVLDPRGFVAVKPSVSGPLVARGLAFLVLAIAAWQAASSARGREEWWAGAGGFVAGLSLLYAGLEVADAAFRSGYLLAGWRAPAVQRDPVVSRSLAEFWGRRWNRVVGGMLFRWFFRPVARRGSAALGVMAAFTASGLLHSGPTLVALDLGAAVQMQGFFMLHGGLVLLERALGVARWPSWAAHGWVVTMMLGMGWLFVGPALRMFGILGG